VRPSRSCLRSDLLSFFCRSYSHQKTFVIPSLEEDVADIVSSFAELSNTQAAKVITYRAEQHAALDLPDFHTFFNDSWVFVVKCEIICRRMIVGLRGTVVGQVSIYSQVFECGKMTYLNFRLSCFFKPSTKYGYLGLRNLLKTNCGTLRRSHRSCNTWQTFSLTQPCGILLSSSLNRRKLFSVLYHLPIPKPRQPPGSQDLRNRFLLLSPVYQVMVAVRGRSIFASKKGRTTLFLLLLMCWSCSWII